VRRSRVGGNDDMASSLQNLPSTTSAMARECFERILRGPRPLYSVFVSLATEPEVAFGLQRRSGLRQPRCPLCGHLVRDFAPDAASRREWTGRSGSTIPGGGPRWESVSNAPMSIAPSPFAIRKGFLVPHPTVPRL